MRQALELPVVVRVLGGMMQPNACPKCFRFNCLQSGSDQDGPYLDCLHCGHLIDLLQPEPEVLARLMALKYDIEGPKAEGYTHNKLDGGGRRNKGRAGFYGPRLGNRSKVWPQR